MYCLLKKKYLPILCISIACLMGCSQSQHESGASTTTESITDTTISDSVFVLKYDFHTIDKVCDLPKSLMEISALTTDSSGHLFAVNDEKALIYKIDIDQCAVIDEYDFGKNGDYEGIELVGDNLFVSKANGNLYQFDLHKKETVQNHKTTLSLANDLEGLGYDFEYNRLILACKGSPNLKDHPKLKSSKAFYAFDLNTNELIEKPVLIISDLDLLQFFEQNINPDHSKSEIRQLKKRLISFSPSAIAMHPVERNYYILSSVGRLVIICSQNNEIQHVEFLNPNKFAQPEGICFAKGQNHVH